MSSQNSSTTQPGEITLITGPMFAAKTTALIHRLEVASIAGKRVCVIKFNQDTRVPGAERCITTHEKSVTKGRMKVKAFPVKDLKGDFPSLLSEKIKRANLIAIDEGQFLDGLADFCVKHALDGKDVVVAALNGDFKQAPFQNIQELIPHVDEIIPLKAVCSLCKKHNAIYTQRMSEEKGLIVIGGKDMYRAVCRDCFHWSESVLRHTKDPIFEMDTSTSPSSISSISSSDISSSSADE